MEIRRAASRHARRRPHVCDGRVRASVGVGSPSTISAAGEETFHIAVDVSGHRVLVRHLRPVGRIAGHHAPVLFIPDPRFRPRWPRAYRFDSVSWMDDLATRGFDVWAFDFLGYGGSDRYPEMQDAATTHAPLGRAPEAAGQIAAVVGFIRTRTRSARVSLIAHSWGTIPAGLFASENPEAIERLVDFGPVAQRAGAPSQKTLPAFDFVSEEAQRSRFDGYVPAGEQRVLDPGHFAAWGPAYMSTDSTSGTRHPRSVQIPNGPSADIADAWSGHLGYDPGVSPRRCSSSAGNGMSSREMPMRNGFGPRCRARRSNGM